MGQNSPFWGRAVKGNQGQSHNLYKRAPCGQISGHDRGRSGKLPARL